MTRRSAVAIFALVPSLARAAGTVTGISASPVPATAGSEVVVTVTATGPCQVYVDFGDKTKAAHLSQYPGTLKHVYAASGKYILRTFAYTSGSEPAGLSRCGGFADMELIVKPKTAARVLAPNRNVPPAAPSGGLKVANPVPSGAGATAESAPAGAPSPTPTPATRR